MCAERVCEHSFAGRSPPVSQLYGPLNLAARQEPRRTTQGFLAGLGTWWWRDPGRAVRARSSLPCRGSGRAPRTTTVLGIRCSGNARLRARRIAAPSTAPSGAREDVAGLDPLHALGVLPRRGHSPTLRCGPARLLHPHHEDRPQRQHPRHRAVLLRLGFSDRGGMRQRRGAHRQPRCVPRRPQELAAPATEGSTTWASSPSAWRPAEP